MGIVSTLIPPDAVEERENRCWEAVSQSLLSWRLHAKHPRFSPNFPVSQSALTSDHPAFLFLNVYSPHSDDRFVLCGSHRQYYLLKRLRISKPPAKAFRRQSLPWPGRGDGGSSGPVTGLAR